MQTTSVWTNYPLNYTLLNDLLLCISAADIIEAHNVEFERVLWYEIMHKRYGYPDLPIEKLRCSAAKCAYYSLPRSLEDAGKALNLDIKKDLEGKKVMLRLCAPDRRGNWNEDPEDLAKLFDYCKQDVDAEYAISEALPDMPEQELETWRLDQTINSRGVKVDVKAIDNIISKLADAETRLLQEVSELTNGEITSTRRIKQVREYLERQGIYTDNLNKETVLNLLETAEGGTKRILELRQMLGKSSVAKFQSMRDYTCADGRMRGLFMFHGASTGRFTGKGPQVHNYPRDSFKDEQIEEILNKPEIDFLEASKCLRGMIIADRFMSADFEQIEARVLAWLADEEKTLQQFRDRLPLYEMASADIYKKPWQEINKEERQIGKVCTLALGYQGWYGALKSMSENYHIELPSEDQCTQIMKAWRNSRPKTVELWKRLENAALFTVKTGKASKVGKIKFAIEGDFLRMELPSGRKISYYKPMIELQQTYYGSMKESISYMGHKAYMKGKAPEWCRVYTYGGKLTENAVQAVSADLLIEAMKRLEASGLQVVLHVHDEIVVENTLTSKEDYVNMVNALPVWAEGLPIAADAWEGNRYRK